MAEVWAVGLATVAVGAYSANEQSKAGERGADAQADAARMSTEEQRRQFDITNANQHPFLEAGWDALRRQQAFLNGDWSGFENSADYTFSRDQQLQALERGAAARGGFTGGGADADRLNLANGLAAQQANAYWNRLAGRAGQGQSTAQNLAGYGAAMAGNIGQNYMDAANARASSYANTANAWSNFGQQAVGAFGGYMGNRGQRTPTGAGAMASGGGWSY